MSKLRFTGIVLVAGMLAIAASQGVEVFINRVLRPDAEYLTWIGDLVAGCGFMVMTTLWLKLRQTQDVLSVLEREQVVMNTQLSIAAEVQRGLLPPVPPPTDGVSWCAAVEPAGKIGGDYYDFLRIDETKMCVVLADVSGKGIPAAVFLSNVRAVLRTLVRETAAPAEILARLSDAVLADAAVNLYVTCLVAVVDTTARTLTYANAGHPAGLLLNRSGIRTLSVGGPPVGLLPGRSYEQESVGISAGDLVVLVSDGVTEALDASGGDAPGRLAREVRRVNDLAPGAVCARLLRAARHSGGPRGVDGWTDDRTVVVFSVGPRPAERGPRPMADAWVGADEYVGVAIPLSREASADGPKRGAA